MNVSLISGGDSSPHYILGLLSGLVSTNIKIDLIGCDTYKNSNVLKYKNIDFYNLRGDVNPDSPVINKINRVIKFYVRLIKYATKTYNTFIKNSIVFCLTASRIQSRARP